MGCRERKGTMVNYVPEDGDIVNIDLSPVKGHEQDGMRPAIVISNKIFNSFTKMAIVCPLSSNTKDFPTHYILEKSKKITGAVLCEHIRSIDYEKRNVKFIEKSHKSDLENIMALLASFI